MAATVSAWAKPGAWALDVEEHESELQKEVSVNGGNHSNGGGTNDYPSLAAAAATKTKKKKPQTLSLQEFTTYSTPKPEEALNLPTGPRERTQEEEQSRLGGGFRSYGLGRGSSDEPRRQGRESNREISHSRADEIDDWAATKKTVERRVGERGFYSDSHSKADESDNWGANKAFVPSSGRRYDRRGSFGSNGSDSDSDRWTKRKEEDGGRRFGSGTGGGGGAFDSLRERRGGYESSNVDSESWGRKREEGASAAGGGARPKLNLQPRTLPLSVSEGQQNGNSEQKPKASNPFGAARPREEVLKEKGQDWKEIDQKLESIKVKKKVSFDIGDGARKAWGKPSLSEDKPERSWKKPELNEVHLPSTEETVNGAVKEIVDGGAEEAVKETVDAAAEEPQ